MAVTHSYEPVRTLPSRQTTDSYIASLRAKIVPRLVCLASLETPGLAGWADGIGVRLAVVDDAGEIALPEDGSPTLILLHERSLREAPALVAAFTRESVPTNAGLVLLGGPGEGPLPERHVLGRVPAGSGEPWLFDILRRAFDHLMLRVWVGWLQDDCAKQSDDMADIQDTSLALSAERNLDTLLNLILTKAREITQADSSTIWVIEERPESRLLRNKAAQNASINIEHHEFTVPVDASSLAGWVALSGESLCLEDVYQLPIDGQPSSAGSRAFDQATGYRTRSMLAMPVRDLEGEIVGVIQAMNRKKRAAAVLSSPEAVAAEVIPFSADRLAMMQALASHAGVALANARAAEDLRRETQRSQILLDVMRSFSRLLSLEDLLDEIMRKTIEVMGADRCTLFLVDEKTDELWAKAGQGIESNEIRFPRHLGLAGHVATTGETVNIREAYEDPRFNPEIDRATGYRTRTILTMPVRHEATSVIGVVQVLNKREGVFDEDDERLLEAICAQAAVALKNAQLFEDVVNMKNYNESILRSIATGVLTLDSSGRCTGVNPAARRILEMDDSALGRPYPEVFGGHRNPRIVHTISTALATMADDHAYEVTAALPSGRSVNLNLNAVPLKDRHGEPVGVVVVAQDITREQRLLSHFARFHSREVAERLARGGEEVSLGGRMLEVAVLFSDIRSYTTLTESIPAERIVAWLNAYFSRLVPRIFRYHGMLDKYIGDAVMAVYGVSESQSHPHVADYAVWSAVEMRRALRLHNAERLMRGEPEMEAGIGLCMGQATYGNIGSEERMDLTVIGDIVNVSARLEELTKKLPHHVLVAENVLQAMAEPDRVPWVDLGEEYVKGKTRPVRIFGIPDAFVYGRIELPSLCPGGGRLLPAITAPPAELAAQLDELLS
jgi:adenylate cyclase